MLADVSDEAHFAFLTGEVNLVTELEFKIYRIGYRTNPELIAMFQGEKGVVGLRFCRMLYCLERELISSELWPGAGFIKNLDYLTARLGPTAMSLNNKNLGEVLYTTKRSAHDSVVDCIAYLLHLGFLRSIGHAQTTYKTKIAEISSGLTPAIAFDEVIELKRESPPSGYRPCGPIRFAIPITPQD